MDHKSVRNYLAALAVKKMQNSDQWVRCPCPLAPWTHESGSDSSPSFGIKTGTDSFYHCYSCGSGDLLRLLEQLKDFGAKPPKYQIANALKILHNEEEGAIILHWDDSKEMIEEIIYPEQWLQQFIPALLHPRARDYISDRGVHSSVAGFLDIRYDKKYDRICFPIRNFQGDLVGLRGRYIGNGEWPRYHIYKSDAGKHNPQHWLGEHWVDFNKPVVMVESVFDLASVYCVYRNVVAPLSSSFSKSKAKRMGNATEVITMFDNGMGGNKARERVQQMFCNVLSAQLLPTEGVSDPGDMEPEEIYTALLPHVGAIEMSQAWVAGL